MKTSSLDDFRGYNWINCNLGIFFKCSGFEKKSDDVIRYDNLFEEDWRLSKI